MKKIFLLLVLSITVMLLGACGDKEKDKENETGTKKETINLRVGVVVGEWSPHYKAAQVWSEALEKETDGQVSLTVFPDGQVGGEREMMEAVQNGSLDIGLLSSVVYANFDPRMSVLDIPYLVSTFEEAETLMDGGVGEKLTEIMLEKGIRNLSWAHNDFRIITNNKKAIASPEDLSKIKMRVPESKMLTDWFQAQGALATPMPFPDIYTALQQGVVDGQDNGPILTFAAKFFEHQNYLTVSNHQYSPIGFFISEKVWKDLPKDIQDIIQSTAREAALVEREAIREFNNKSIQSMEEAGLEVIYPSNEEIERFKETTDPFIAQIRSLAGDELTDFVLKEAKYTK